MNRGGAAADKTNPNSTTPFYNGSIVNNRQSPDIREQKARAAAAALNSGMGNNQISQSEKKGSPKYLNLQARPQTTQ